ncbi:MAG: MFS transporter [Corynebacterium flavescens]|uniref:MFS transporter n=1 Tax=Corynebacterium flavescens TaxID=28028 RepID=UPI002649101C|nr:MFS transporter [Corynebacterium flavescens]MDN6432087.1 MFS transporter [Corynebacterium flavescens]
MRQFHHILVNTLIANVTTGFLFFALTFWIYLQTGDVALTGIVTGSYMASVALGSVFFGSVVDHHYKKNVMVFAATATLVCYLLAAAVWVVWLDHESMSISDPALWAFILAVTAGSVVEHMRNIALSTTVTLLVPEEDRDKANGLVGAVQGVAFMVTSVIAGLAIGFIGMAATLWVSLGLTVVALVHLLPIAIPEAKILSTAETTTESTTAAGSSGPSAADPTVLSKGIDLKGSLLIISAVPGLLALILFSCFNNLIGGVYAALMDPYGLELFSPQVWGIVLGVTGTGFVFGGMIVARTGLGTNPVRTLLLVDVAVAMLGMLFGLREWWWLYAGGIFLFMLTVPAAEAAEQTILQRVVPFRQQGRVFGLAMAVEMAASPLATFAVAILSQAYLIPWMAGPGAQTIFGVILGEGTTRGMALMFFISGFIMLVVVLLALKSRPYRRLSAYYAGASQDIAGSAQEKA